MTVPSPEWRATTSTPRDDGGRSGSFVGGDEEGCKEQVYSNGIKSS